VASFVDAAAKVFASVAVAKEQRFSEIEQCFCSTIFQSK
jgi:hypothetical protein